MLEFARYEGRHRLRGAVVLTALLGALAGLDLWVFPSIQTAGIDLQAYVEAWPPALREAFGIESLASVEGFLAAELYAFGWVILLGLYVAYSAASMIAGDVEDERMDILLAMPVSRARVLAEKFLSILVPIVLINAATPVIVLAGLAAIGETIDLVSLLMVHALSIPYLLATAGIGLLASVAFDRESVAQRVAMGVVFGLFLAESIISGTDYAEFGALSPTRHYDPTAILVHGEYDLVGAGLLLAAALVFVLAAQLWFGRKDIA